MINNNLTYFTILFLIFSNSVMAQQYSKATITAYTDGKVWTGDSFKQKNFFVQNGKFINAKISEADSVVSLDRMFVIPPFGDAHTHNFGVGGYSIKIAEEDYLSKGIFYAADLTNPYSEIKQVQDHFNTRNTVDVVYANGGLTSTGSHPTGAMERIFTDKEKITLENLELEGDAYWFIDTISDLELKWPKIQEQNPDVIKIYLTHVKKGLAKETCYGLCPDVAKAIVNKAHSHDIRVFAHVNTADDVKYALEAGVDAIAHLPSGNDNIKIEQDDYWLDHELIQKIGSAGLILTPTASLLIEDADPNKLKKEIEKQKEQLKSLHLAGVKIALGADEWRENSLYEALYLYEYDFFDNKTLLNILTRQTAQAIFPNRKIGVIKSGYEASFLVLENNPIQNFLAIKTIKTGIKEGVLVLDK